MRKILLTAFAAALSVSSVSADTFVVKTTADGTIAAGQVLDNTGTAIVVKSNFAANKNKDLNKGGLFPDGKKDGYFGKGSLAMRVDKAPTAEIPTGTEKAGYTSFEVTVSEKLDSLIFYTEASGSNRNYYLWDCTNNVRLDGEKRIDETLGYVGGSNYGMMTAYGNIEPGTYTFYNTGFGGGFCGIVYKTVDVLLPSEIAYPVASYDFIVGETTDFPELSNPHGLPVTYASSDMNVATISETGAIAVINEGVTEITATFGGDATYKAAVAKYVLNVRTTLGLVAYGVEGEANHGYSIDGTTATATVSVPQDGGKYDCIALKNSWNAAENNNYILLTAENGFKKGDVLTLKGVIRNKDAAKRSAVKIYSSADTQIGQSADFVNTQLDETTEIVPYVLTIPADAENLYIARDGNTAASIYYISVIRNLVPVEVVAPEAPAILLNGEAYEAQTIDLEGLTKTISMTAAEGCNIYYRFVAEEEEDVQPETPAEAPARVGAPTVTYEGEVYKLVPADGIELEYNGVLYYLAHNPAVDAYSPVKELFVTGGKIVTALDEINADANAPVEYFNLQGIRVANPENGVFIRRQGSTVTKVVK